MRRLILTQTILDVAGDEGSPGETRDVVLTLFNKALQAAGFGAMEYNNVILTTIELKDL